MHTNAQQQPRAELWAGVECTIARVGDRWVNQMQLAGHLQRLEDFDRFAELGFSALRFPILWEMVSPNSPEEGNWEWPDRALERVRQLGLRPIAGLIHHGSGPHYTSLIDPRFPVLLAEHARRVAERFPWIDAYTPVNEPLTTARFSGLYGLWFPHGVDFHTFARCLLNQCRATVLCMRAIREINPKAKLVQTDDLGKVFSTPALAYQADYENERRWLAWDLICGRVGTEHPLYSHLIAAEVAASELAWFVENACAPDIIGVNHYLSSNRYLDEDLSRYPEQAHAGNHRQRYADVLAARVIPDDEASPADLLLETWQRYGIALAITEVHNGCTREEQLRWLKYVWQGVEQAAAAGARIEAVTPWSLLGAFDWDSLLTRDRNHYEPGVFDLRAPRPRPTALAAMIKELASGEEPSHPVLESPGWWQRNSRFTFGHRPLKRSDGVWVMPRRQRPILITGASGTLGQAFARLCVVRGLPYRLLRRSEMDIADADSVAAALAHHDPWAVVNTAGSVRVDDAEIEWERCFRENTSGATTLAALCSQRGARLVTFSSDMVFDGRKNSPYVESDPTSPLNEYGRSKLAAETAVLQLLPEALVVRTSAFFGPWDDYNFLTIALRALSAGQRFPAAADAVVSPTYVPDLVHATLDLLVDAESGIWHLANQGALSWADFAALAAAQAGFDTGLIEAVPLAELSLAAPRPHYSVLGSERGQLLPPLTDALERYFLDRSRYAAPELQMAFEPAA